MSSETVRRDISVGFINGGMHVNVIIGGLGKTVVLCGIGEINDIMLRDVGVFAFVIIVDSVFTEAKTGKSIHSPQWSSTE